MKTILHLCADTGSDSKPYKINGYNVILIGSKIGVENFEPPNNVYGIIANPPCTEFSTVKNIDIPRNFEKGLFLVNECLRIIKICTPHFWYLENPATGYLKKFLGPPVFTYQPWEFGSPWTKKTALWGNFNIPKKIYKNWDDVPNKIPELYIRPGRTKPSLVCLTKNAIKYIPEFSEFFPESNSEFRSLCSQKFANAFYEVNK